MRYVEGVHVNPRVHQPDEQHAAATAGVVQQELVQIWIPARRTCRSSPPSRTAAARLDQSAAPACRDAPATPTRAPRPVDRDCRGKCRNRSRRRGGYRAASAAALASPTRAFPAILSPPSPHRILTTAADGPSWKLASCARHRRTRTGVPRCRATDLSALTAEDTTPAFLL